MQRRYTIGADNIWISDGVELGDRSRVRQVVCSTGKKKNGKHPLQLERSADGRRGFYSSSLQIKGAERRR